MNKHSLRDAINAKCKDCIYDPLSGLGAWREQVTACTATECPLYPVRPRSKARRPFPSLQEGKRIAKPVPNNAQRSAISDRGD